MEMMQKQITEMKQEIKVLSNVIRGLGIVTEDEEVYMRCNGERYGFSEAQIILLEQALPIVEKYKRYTL